MPQEQEKRILLRQFILPGLLLLVLCTLVAYRFTSTSPADEERARARVLLGTIHRLETSEYKKFGRYIPINEISNAQILKLIHVPGKFSYRVDVTDSSFLATARADLDGDGEFETWQVDHHGPQPVLASED